jgi:hypothetical protein
MRAREMMARLGRLPKKRGGETKVWDLSLLSPEKQDRVDELLKMILVNDDHSENLDTAFAELDELVRNLPLLGRDDPEQGPLIEVPRELARYWEFHHGASKWCSLDFYKLSKVQIVRFVELCEQHGFREGTDTPIRAQMLPLHEWPASTRTELQEMLDISGS